MNKTAYLGFDTCVDNSTNDDNFNKVGQNTGNLVFDNALKNLFKADTLTYSEIAENAWKYNRCIVKDFIWIQEHADMSYYRRIIDIFKGKPIIPISIGLQADEYKSDFSLHKETVSILKELQEQSKLAVRGYYTAEILNKYGIKNTQVVGCPSLYLGGYGFKLRKENTINTDKIASNYATLSKETYTEKDLTVLDYLAKNTSVFVDQTKCYFTEEMINSLNENVRRKIINDKKIFFKYGDWEKFISQYEFSIGARFHGNVISVLSGVPALFLLFDSRVREMSDFFKLPTIDIEDFDINKPISYYYEMADYSEFNKCYEEKMDQFIEFCLDNNIELTNGMDIYFKRKQNQLTATKRKRLFFK